MRQHQRHDTAANGAFHLRFDPAQQPHGGKRQREHQKSHGHEQGSGVAGLLKLECGLIAVDRQQPGRLARPAAGQHEHLIEGAEGVDGPEHDGDGEHRPDHRQGQVPEQAPGPRAVDPGRLEGFGWQGLQPGEQDQEHERRPFPDVERDEPDESANGVAQDLNRPAAQRFGQRRQHAGIAGVDQAKDDGDHDRCDHHGHDQHGAQQANTPKLTQAEKGKRQTKHRFDRNGECHEAKRDPERIEKLVVPP